MELLHMIYAIRDAKGAKAKVEAIRNLPEEHVGGLQTVVKYALDNMRSYYISSIDVLPTGGLFAKPTLPCRPGHLLMFLDFLNEKGSANAADKSKLANIRAGLDDNDKIVADLIIGRDLKCGAGLSTFRKVWGTDFLPDMEYALMGAYDEKGINNNINFDEGAFSQLKSDGKRCILTKRGTKYEGRSRNGKPIGYMPNVCQAASKLGFHNVDFDLDGELVVLDKNGKILPRTTGNGIIAKISSGKISKEELSRVRFVVWDLIIRTESGIKETYGVRFCRLKQALSLCDSSIIFPTESKVVWSLREAKEHYQEMVQRGEEGTVLKTTGSVWTPGDSKSCRAANGYKFKEEFPAEFKIVGWYYGKKCSKFEKYIGGFECESSCGQVKFKVGSGLTDKMRMIENPDVYIGQIVEIIYNSRVMAKNSTIWSLFLPRVSCFRDDKSVADSLERLIEQEEAARKLGMQ